MLIVDLTMPNLDLTPEELDLCWVALRAYVREQKQRGDEAEANLAHNLSRKVRALRDAGRF